MPFKDFTELVQPLVLPINGKQYTIPPLTIAQGAVLSDHLDPESKAEPWTDDEFCAFMLGEALVQMTADGVPDAARKRAATTALAEYQVGREVAEVMWETGGDPKAVQEQARRSLLQDHKPAATTPRAAASTTKRRASGTGTKTSPKS